MAIVFSLFEGRHELPQNEGALFSSFDFEKFKGVKTHRFNEAIALLILGVDVEVLVTGLTPALIEVINAVPRGKVITLLHYNSKTGEYIPQKVEK